MLPKQSMFPLRKIGEMTAVGIRFQLKHCVLGSFLMIGQWRDQTCHAVDRTSSLQAITSVTGLDMLWH